MVGQSGGDPPPIQSPSMITRTLARLRPGHLRALAVVALIANAVAVFLPNPPSVPAFPNEDKVVHVLLFGVPTFLGLLGGWRARILLPLLCAYAVSTEVIQGTLESATRSASVGDLAADTVGIALAWFAAGRVLRHTEE